ncbi:MAG: YciI family protein [Myxococcaceae bacterium]
MNYLVLLYRDEQKYFARSDEDRQRTAENHRPYIEMLKAKGNYGASARLVAASSATTLRNVDGKVVSTDGPFAEAREQLGGFYLIEAADLDEAVRLVREMPGLQHLPAAEIRPLMPAI